MYRNSIPNPVKIHERREETKKNNVENSIDDLRIIDEQRVLSESSSGSTRL